MLWTVVLGKTLESPLDCKEIKAVNRKGNQSWISIGRTAAEIETPILWPPDAKSWLIRKDPDAGKDWRQGEKGMTDEMVGWHLWLDGHEFEQALGVGDGQGGLAFCSPWGCKELDTTEQLNWTELNWYWLPYPTSQLNMPGESLCWESAPWAWVLGEAEFCLEYTGLKSNADVSCSQTTHLGELWSCPVQ